MKYFQERFFLEEYQQGKLVMERNLEGIFIKIQGEIEMFFDKSPELCSLDSNQKLFLAKNHRLDEIEERSRQRSLRSLRNIEVSPWNKPGTGGIFGRISKKNPREIPRVSHQFLEKSRQQFLEEFQDKTLEKSRAGFLYESLEKFQEVSW